MLFPWTLRFGWIFRGELFLLISFVSIIIWQKIQKSSAKGNENVYSQDPCVDNKDSEEMIEQYVEDSLDSMIAVALDQPQKMMMYQECFAVCDNSLNLDQLIDLGFKEKNSENFEQAAYFFYQALFLEPLPDLAFYLIIDCYWLWSKLGERDFALAQLQVYVPKYFFQFNPDLQNQFEKWMAKENISLI